MQSACAFEEATRCQVTGNPGPFQALTYVSFQNCVGWTRLCRREITNTHSVECRPGPSCPFGLHAQPAARSRCCYDRRGIPPPYLPKATIRSCLSEHSPASRVEKEGIRFKITAKKNPNLPTYPAGPDSLELATTHYTNTCKLMMLLPG